MYALQLHETFPFDLSSFFCCCCFIYLHFDFITFMCGKSNICVYGLCSIFFPLTLWCDAREKNQKEMEWWNVYLCLLPRFCTQIFKFWKVELKYIWACKPRKYTRNLVFFSLFLHINVTKKPRKNNSSDLRHREEKNKGTFECLYAIYVPHIKYFLMVLGLCISVFRHREGCFRSSYCT